jgi:hypothetical protein
VAVSEIARDVAVWHTRIRAELTRRKRILDPDFTTLLKQLREVRLADLPDVRRAE